MGAKIVEGIFITIRPDTLDALYAVLDREGYAGDSDGVARFLSDVAGGLLDEKEEPPPAPEPVTLRTAMNLARKHGPTVAKVAAAMLRSRGAG